MSAVASSPPPAAAADSLFAGIDCSTQSLKIIVIDSSCSVVASVVVSFDADLPQYGTSGGVLRGSKHLQIAPAVSATVTATATATDDEPDDGVVVSPSAMFFDAMDLAFQRLTKLTDIKRIAAIACSGQQHGSVWWSNGASQKLAALNSEPKLTSNAACADSLSTRLAGAFALPAAPIWMDSSTRKYALEMESALGGAQAMADICGSRAYERFTGVQIKKMIHLTRQFEAKSNAAGVYSRTERISLVSSALASVLRGAYVPIDASDGAGMCLMDIYTREWSDKLLAAVAGSDSKQIAELRTKLGESVAPPHSCVGTVAAYFQNRYGFRADCVVCASTGDNPSSLAGVELSESGDVCVSLGTSDTLFAVTKTARPSGSIGAVFPNPIDPTSHVSMLTVKNGSLVRERVRDSATAADRKPDSWANFNAALTRTTPGNQNRFGFFYFDPEITPHVPKAVVARFDADSKPVESFAAAAAVTVAGADSKATTPAFDADARAVIESQFLNLRLASASLGLDQPKRIIATGGASQNHSVLTILANVFGASVFVGSGSGDAAAANSAARGAAYRALHAFVNQQKQKPAAKSGATLNVSFAEALKSTSVTAATTATAVPSNRVTYVRCVEPNPTAVAVYRAQLPHFQSLQQKLIAS